MLGEEHHSLNGQTSSNINKLLINGHLNGFSQRPSPYLPNGEASPAVMRNPKLFYEAAFVARPKLQAEVRKAVNGNSSCPSGNKTPITNGYHFANEGARNGVATPESLKGNLRKEHSTERRSSEKKRVQFDLKNGAAVHVCCENGGTDSDEDEDGEFDEVEKSLMQGFSEFGCGAMSPLTNGHSRKKPDLSLNFGAVSNSVKGETINTELPLEEQTWYFGTISRQDAEDILRHCTEGCYVVRSCELAAKRDYSLAIKSSCGFMHLKIHRQSDDLYRLADFNRVFFTVPDLIEYYSSEKLPIRGAEYTILLHPVHQQLL